MGLNFTERLGARYLLRMTLSDLTENAFEKFFHDLMCLVHDDFLDVRTAGSMGDLGSDGILIHENKLYACYAPATARADAVRAKFDRDLESALRQRGNHFDHFVFVHNDLRGMHPVIAGVLKQAAIDHPLIKFDQIGYRKLQDLLCGLEKSQVEDVLEKPLPAEVAYGPSMDDIQPLLEHLRGSRRHAAVIPDLSPVSSDKLDFNRFSEDVRGELVQAMARTAQIEDYYNKRIDPTERDEVAAGFRSEFVRIRQELGDTADSDDIVYQLELYVLGNRAVEMKVRKSATVVLAYFFESCDIFDNVPEDWSRDSASAEVA